MNSPSSNNHASATKALWLIRHAKSAHPFVVTDMERPLGKRGLADCPNVARAVADTPYTPTRIIASDSLRTRQTAELLNQLWDANVSLDHALYMGDLEDVEDLVLAIEDSHSCAAFVTHLPTLQDCMWKSRSGWTTATLPTLAAVCLVHEGDWVNFDFGTASCALVLKPKELRGRI